MEHVRIIAQRLHVRIAAQRLHVRIADATPARERAAVHTPAPTMW